MSMLDKENCGKMLTALGVSSMLFLSSTAYAASPLLKMGSRGREVSQLQQHLKEANVYNYTVTGYYGSITRDAVIKFQRQKGLVADGIAGSKTLAALNGTYTTSRGTSSSRLLKRGMRGSDVRELQELLKAKGYHSSSADGIFGPRTEQALKDFQKANGLVADGIAGQRTLSALRNGNTTVNRGTSNRLLKRGMRGSDVRELQELLKAKGYHSSNADGIFGSRTEQAVKNFQRVNGLVADGIVGQATMNKLRSASSSRGSSPSNKTSAELISWSTVNALFSRGATATVTDVNTGKSFRVYRMGGIHHADVEPLTANDTAIMKSIYGNWSWARRPIIVNCGGRNIAASMNGMPHGRQTIRNNNFNGQFCIHFLGSKTHGGGRVDPDHQAAVRRAAR